MQAPVEVARFIMHVDKAKKAESTPEEDDQIATAFQVAEETFARGLPSGYNVRTEYE